MAGANGGWIERLAKFSVPGTIAPARELPDVNGGGNGDEDPMKIFMANLNLFVPVVAAVLVIIVAVIVICVMRGSRHSGDKGKKPANQSAVRFSSPEQARSHLPYVTAVTTTRTWGVTSRGYQAGST